jgi:glycosyltransferase involved in cell wall biosynthesis
MIRLMHVIPTLVKGGAEKQLCLLATHLPKDQFDVQVSVLTHTGLYEPWLTDDGISVVQINKRWKLDPGALWRLRKAIREFAPDILQTWMFAANVYGRLAAMMESVPVIVAGERCADHWKVGYEHALDKYLARRTERIVVNSAAVRDFYTNKQRLGADKFTIIPNGIDAAAAKGAGESREQLASEIGIPTRAPWIGVVARLWPQKRLKDVIWAADLLKVAEHQCHVLLFGDGPLRWRLERYAKQVNVADRVHFLGHREDVAQWLPHLRCLWLASQYEGQSNAIMEAMAAGVPVVASDIPANRTLIDHGETGLLYPVGDRGDLARQTHRLLSDDQLADRLGRAGRERIQNEFGVEKMVRSYAQLYEELVEGERDD